MGKILIVDDDDDLREMLAEMLGMLGYDVLQAEHGARALEVLNEQDVWPCLMLLDSMMPVMSGPELLKVLANHQRFAALPVVVISAGGRAEEMPQARRFILKPLSVAILQSVVKEYCDCTESIS